MTKWPISNQSGMSQSTTLQQILKNWQAWTFWHLHLRHLADAIIRSDLHLSHIHTTEQLRILRAYPVTDLACLNRQCVENCLVYCFPNTKYLQNTSDEICVKGGWAFWRQRLLVNKQCDLFDVRIPVWYYTAHLYFFTFMSNHFLYSLLNSYLIHLFCNSTLDF